MSEENLWGELPPDEGIETPIAILRTQAVALEKLTGGILEGRVISRQTDSNAMWHEFRIIAPALGNYSITILSLRHGVPLYPVEISRIDDVRDAMTEEILAAGHATRPRLKNAEALKASLKSCLQSETVREIVASLRAQVKDASYSPA